MRYRGNWLEVEITAHRLRVSAPKSMKKSIKVGVKDQVVELEPGARKELEL
ncbi:MAG: glycosyl hydrolase family 65 protein [Candidatus Bipolaricaulia bacterium]